MKTQNVIIIVFYRLKKSEKYHNMKNLICFFFTVLSLQLVAQTDFYAKKGVVIEGYDVTEYFNNSPKEGMKKYATKYDGAMFYFANLNNKNKFEANPEKFVPQYGGYCAYAIGLKGDKVKIDPKTYQIRGGKLYLFYNSWGVNTLDYWNHVGAEELQVKADFNWEKIKNGKK